MMAKQSPQNTVMRSNQIPSQSETSRARNERLERWVRAHNPANDPPFSRWDAVGLLLVLILFLGQQHAPGLLADIGTYQVASWEWGVYARLTPLFLASTALFAVRAMHPITRLSLYFQIGYLCMRLAEIRITHEPLTAVFALLMVIFSLQSIRIIIRPNEFELAQEFARHERENHDH